MISTTTDTIEGRKIFRTSMSCKKWTSNAIMS